MSKHKTNVNVYNIGYKRLTSLSFATIVVKRLNISIILVSEHYQVRCMY